MRRKNKKKLSPANLEIMKIIWEQGGLTISDVFEAVNAGRSVPVRRTTVQVQMNRLMEYGWLLRRKKGRTYIYSAAAGRQKTRREILADIRDRVFGGSRAELVRCLLEDGPITREEAVSMRDLMRDLEEKEP
jgi:BlaI family penicillinase repressor